MVCILQICNNVMWRLALPGETRAKAHAYRADCLEVLCKRRVSFVRSFGREFKRDMGLFKGIGVFVPIYLSHGMVSIDVDSPGPSR